MFRTANCQLAQFRSVQWRQCVQVLKERTVYSLTYLCHVRSFAFITSAKEVMLSPLFVCLSVCLSVCVHEIFRDRWQWASE